MRRSTRPLAARAAPLLPRALALLAGSPALAARAAADAAARQGAALRLPVAETSFDPAQDHRPVLAHRHAAHLRGASTATTTWRGRRRSSRSPPTACPRSRPTSAPGPSSVQPGIYFADDPAFKGQRRELVAAGLRLRAQAHRRPGEQEPRPGACWRTTGIVGLRELRKEALDEQEALRLRHADRRPARARPLHAAVQAGASRGPRFIETLRRQRPVRRGGARGGRALRRPDRRAPGGHRAVPARRSGGAARSSCWSATRLPRDALRRRARGRRRRGPGHAGAASRAGACRWSTGSRSRSSRSSSRAGWRS